MRKPSNRRAARSQATREAAVPTTPADTPGDDDEDLDRFQSHLARDTTHFENVHGPTSNIVERLTNRAPAPTIVALQGLLAAHGYQVDVSGVWDHDTRKAIARAQADFQLPEHDYVDRRFIAKLATELVTK